MAESDQHEGPRRVVPLPRQEPGVRPVRWWLVLISVLAAVLAAVGLGVADSRPNRPPELVVTGAAGQPVRVGAVTVTVVRLEAARSFPGRRGPVEALPGAQLVLAQVRVEHGSLPASKAGCTATVVQPQPVERVWQGDSDMIVQLPRGTELSCRGPGPVTYVFQVPDSGLPGLRLRFRYSGQGMVEVGL